MMKATYDCQVTAIDKEDRGTNGYPTNDAKLDPIKQWQLNTTFHQ